MRTGLTHASSTEPASEVNPDAIAVIAEVGIDMAGEFPKSSDGRAAMAFPTSAVREVAARSRSKDATV
jgi:hypothetical protein